MDEVAGMRNEEASQILSSCLTDLNIVKATLVGLDGAPAAPYLRKYSVIRASGSIEVAFKKVIADKVDHGSHEQIKNFIKKNVRNTSKNPKLEVIENALHEFDPRWSRRFAELVGLANRPRLKKALADLVTDRNTFAHGGESNMSIETIIEHFRDGAKVVAFLDQAVHETYDEPLAQSLEADENPGDP
jgi:hypothetical protein